MKTMTTSKAEGRQKIRPYTVNQALVALELGPTDSVLLDYLDYFTTQIPTASAYFLHVLPKFDLFNVMLEKETQTFISNYELNEEVIGKMEEEIRDRLTRKNSIHVEFDVHEGDPLEELLRLAEDIGTDLAIIGQKSESRQHGILDKNLARKVECNALIVPDQAKARISTILVPIDFSSNSIRALQTAIGINKQLDPPARIICANVYEMPNLSVYRIQKTRDELRKMLEADRREAFRAFLNTYVPDEKDQLETVLIERIRPGIASYLMEYAEEQGVDLLVVGARGHSKVELLLLGSVTERLLSINETIPTLVVK